MNTVTSVLFATETIGPAAVGLVLLGDRTQAGLGPLALGGCASIVLATALLSRHPGEAVHSSQRAPAGTRLAAPAVDLLPTRQASALIPTQRTAFGDGAERERPAGRHRRS